MAAPLASKWLNKLLDHMLINLIKFYKTFVIILEIPGLSRPKFYWDPSIAFPSLEDVWQH